MHGTLCSSCLRAFVREINGIGLTRSRESAKKNKKVKSSHEKQGHSDEALQLYSWATALRKDDEGLGCMRR